MCYYITINIAKKDSVKVNNIEIKNHTVVLHKPIQNGFSYAPWPIIKKENNNLQMLEAHWEFIAPWSKDWDSITENRKKFTTLNAKGESIFTSKLYQQAAASQRCLVVASGFFEWRDVQLPNAKKPTKVPYYISMPNQEYFFMAGIYNNWLDKSTGELITSFAIVTTAANSLMAQIHNSQKRMPVILQNELAEQWITETNKSNIEKLATYQIPSNQLMAYTIDKEFRIMPVPNLMVDYDLVPALVMD